MFDRLPSVRHAAALNLGDAPVSQSALHRPGIFVAVEVSVDQFRQAEFLKSEPDLRLERFAPIAASLIGAGDPDAAAGRAGFAIDFVETDPADRCSPRLELYREFIGSGLAACV